MEEQLEIVVGEVNGEPVSLEDALTLAKWQSPAPMLREAEDWMLILAEAPRRGIAVSDEELQEAADRFRQQRGLHRAGATAEWLSDRLLSGAQWEWALEAEVLRRKLREAVAEDRVETYFAEHREEFDSAVLSRIVLDHEGLAEELRGQAAEEGADFHALARRYTRDMATRDAGGYAGVARRRELPPEMADLVFAAEAPGLVGPVGIAEGWLLLWVEERRPAELDDRTRREIAAVLFEEWLEAQRSEARISRYDPVRQRLVRHSGPEEWLLQARLPGARPLAESRIERKGLKSGAAAPAFELPDLRGVTRSLQEFRGRRVLLVFSDPRCGPCQTVTRALVKLHQRQGGRGPAVVMIGRGDPEENRKKAEEHGIEFPVLLQRRWEVSKPYGLFFAPAAFMIDEDGVLTRDAIIGAAEIEAVVRALADG